MLNIKNKNWYHYRFSLLNSLKKALKRVSRSFKEINKKHDYLDLNLRIALKKNLYNLFKLITMKTICYIFLKITSVFTALLICCCAIVATVVVFPFLLLSNNTESN